MFDRLLNLVYPLKGLSHRAAAAYELGNVPIEIDDATWALLDRSREQCSRQWKLLKTITSETVDYLPPSAVLALVNGITKTYLFNPSHPPNPLIDLLDLQHYHGNLRLKKAVAVGLAIAAIANLDYHDHGRPRNNMDARLRRARAKKAYGTLTLRKFDSIEIENVLLFGLFNLLTRQDKDLGWVLSARTTEAIKKVLNATSCSILRSYHGALMLPSNFGPEQHLARAASSWLSPGINSPDSQEFMQLAIPHLSILLIPASRLGCQHHVLQPLMHDFPGTENTTLRVPCLQAIQRAVQELREIPDCVLNQLAQRGFLVQLVKLTNSNDAIALHSMRCLWTIAGALVVGLVSPNDPRYSIIAALLQLLHSGLTEDLAEVTPVQRLNVLGLADLWLPILSEMCRSNPQDVLDSQILSDMITYYQQLQDSSVPPRPPQVLSPSDNTPNWLVILKELQASCTAEVERGKREGQQEPKSSKQAGPEGREESNDETVLWWVLSI